MNKIYFISGVSGVGKSSTIHHLKKLLSEDKYDIRDIDERGVPDGGGLEWLNKETRHWLDVAKLNALNGKALLSVVLLTRNYLKKCINKMKIYQLKLFYSMPQEIY